MAHEFLDQHGCVHVALWRCSGARELRCGYEKGGDGGNAVGAKEGELKGFLEGKGKFEFGDDFLNVVGIFVGHGSIGAFRGVRKGFFDGTEASITQNLYYEEVDEK